jgi:pyruvate kinase
MGYKITATLGPISNSPQIWYEMVSAGVTGFRLNTSHIPLSQIEEWLERLQRFREAIQPELEVVLDLQGSKWRLGSMEPWEVRPGQLVELRLASSSHGDKFLPVPHQDFFKSAPASSSEILLNDAKIRMIVESITPEVIKARTVQGGEISARKGITFSESSFRTETLGEKDHQIIERTSSLPGLGYALSYVKDSFEMDHYREAIGKESYLIVKLERRSAIDEASQIANYSNEVWLCRGDLGSELGIRGMAKAVSQFSNHVRDIPAPVLLAGQVLEHMVDKPAPTRSEVSILYDSLDRGFSGFVLSDETAVGKYPVESCHAAALFLSWGQ